MDPRRHAVKLPAALTGDVVATLAGPLRRLARTPSIHEVVLDAGDTVDLSARGLAMLVAVGRLARESGARVVLVGVDETLQGLFAAARLDYRPRVGASVVVDLHRPAC